MIDNSENVMIRFRISKSTRNKFRKVCIDSDSTMQEILEALLLNFLNYNCLGERRENHE